MKFRTWRSIVEFTETSVISFHFFLVIHYKYHTRLAHSFHLSYRILKQTFFVRDNGIDIAITNAIEAITQCLRSEDGFCTSVPDQGISMKSLGL